MSEAEEIKNLSIHAQKALAQDAPMPVKMMAASGMAPLQPAELLYVLLHLSKENDSTLAGKATATLLNLPASVLMETLSSNLGGALLDGLSRLFLKKEDALERIILNKNTLDHTISFLAQSLNSEKLLEIIAANEKRLLSFPEIIEKLYFNKSARMSTVERAIELAVRNKIELTGIPTFEEAKKAIEGELIFEASNEPSPDDIKFNGALLAAQKDDISIDEAEDVLENPEKQDSEEKASKIVQNMQSNLSSMTVSQKIRIATLGSSPQRSILIRDSNKLVIMAVLKSPALNDAEIRRFSMLKSLPEEAVRYIANKRDWTKQYGIKLNLVNNPRTPIELSLRFMNHLRPLDLKALERSKEIPGVIKNAAIELRRKRSK